MDFHTFPLFIFFTIQKLRNELKSCTERKQTFLFPLGKQTMCVFPEQNYLKMKIIKNKTKCNLFQCTMWCYSVDWRMKNTKLCSAHEERESTTERLISTKDDSKLSGGLRRRKMRQKGFWIQIFSEKEKKKRNHPAALIIARRKQSSRFALMRSSSHACYSSWSASPSACFPWLCHDSIANRLQHRSSAHSLQLRYYFLLLKEKKKSKD